MDSEKSPRNPEEIALNPRFIEHERALLRALLQASDYGILLSGLDRQDIIANRRLGELFGIAPQEIVDSDPRSAREMALARVRDPEAFQNLLLRTDVDPLLQQEDEIEVDLDITHVLRRATGPVRDTSGTPIGRLWTFLDITETKRLQAEVQAQLKARTHDFRVTSDVLRAMNDLCRLATPHKTTDEILYEIVRIVTSLVGWNAGALLLVPTMQADLLSGVVRTARGKNKRLQMSRREDSVLDQALDLARCVPETAAHVYPGYSGALARKMGCKRIAVVSLCSDGVAHGALAVGTDKADIEPMGEEARFRSHLAALADQIALTIANHRLQTELRSALESLRTTQRQLVEMEKLRTAGMLATSIAHDIRNILTSMQMELAAYQDSVVEPISTQLTRFTALTHRLLAFSRPSVLETHPTSVRQALQRVVSLVQGQAEIYGVEIVLDLPDTLPLISADGNQIEHLFVNLCLNSIQSMAEHGGTLLITVRADRHWLHITVKDDGAGIAADILPRIFDPFFTGRANGLGLGLFSCKRIVEEHGGQLTVESHENEGAIFTVSLPAMASEPRIEEPL